MRQMFQSRRCACVLSCAAAAAMVMSMAARPAEAVQIHSIFHQVTSDIIGNDLSGVTELSPNSVALPTTSGPYYNQAHTVQTNPEGSSVSGMSTMDLNYDFG